MISYCVICFCVGALWPLWAVSNSSKRVPVNDAESSCRPEDWSCLEGKAAAAQRAATASVQALELEVRRATAAEQVAKAEKKRAMATVKVARTHTAAAAVEAKAARAYQAAIKAAEAAVFAAKAKAVKAQKWAVEAAVGATEARAAETQRAAVDASEARAAKAHAEAMAAAEEAQKEAVAAAQARAAKAHAEALAAAEEAQKEAVSASEARAAKAHAEAMAAAEEAQKEAVAAAQARAAKAHAEALAAAEEAQKEAVAAAQPRADREHERAVAAWAAQAEAETRATSWRQAFLILLLISTSIIAERAWHGAHAVDAQWGEEARAIGQLDFAAAEAARDEACRLRAEAIESLNAANLAFQNAEAEHEQEVAHYTENISMFNQLVTEGEERLQVLETQNAELERRCGECEKQMHKLKAQRVCWLCNSGEELPGRPMRCPDGHAICEGCMDAMLEARASDYTGLVKVCCSFLKVGNQACGREYTTDVLERASSAAYARYNVALALHEQEEAARAAAAAALPPLAEGVVALTPEEVRLIAQVRRPLRRPGD